MRPDDAVHADVQNLLGNPTVLLDAVGWNADEGGDLGGQCAASHQLLAVQHELQGIAQAADVVNAVLHLEHAAVIVGGAGAMAASMVGVMKGRNTGLPSARCLMTPFSRGISVIGQLLLAV